MKSLSICLSTLCMGAMTYLNPIRVSLIILCTAYFYTTTRMSNEYAGFERECQARMKYSLNKFRERGRGYNISRCRIDASQVNRVVTRLSAPNEEAAVIINQNIKKHDQTKSLKNLVKENNKRKSRRGGRGRGPKNPGHRPENRAQPSGLYT